VKTRFIQPEWPAPASVTAYTTTRLAGEETFLAVPAGVQMKQVHGNAVVDAAAASDDVAADACFSRQVRIACRIVTADCLPILLCNRAGNEVAAIHAGWRGLHAGVVEATLAQLQTAPADLLAWLGPAISQAHYEVGGELREAFLATAPASMEAQVESCFYQSGDRFHADLAGLARLRLEFAGLTHVYGGEHCTYADPGLFHSYRRDGADTGRMSSVIYFSES
jgi:YfiH family protein